MKIRRIKCFNQSTRCATLFIPVCFMGLFFFFCSPCLAAVETTAGALAAIGGNSFISVSAPYTGDDNGNNRLLIEWGLDGGDYTLGSQTLEHAASPYVTAITGLNNGTTYQIRVTYLDTDNVINPVGTKTALIAKNSNIHNSLSTGSSKWGSSGWGIAGGKYGKFTCRTCHISDTTNIKNVRQNLTAPNGVDRFPIQTAVPPNDRVTYSSTVNGAADMGDDTGGHASSAKICEACHSITEYHRFNTVTDPDGAGPLTGQTELAHYNQSDCINCHKHQNGFGHGGDNDCESCHGGDSGYEYAPGKFREGRGTIASHSTHTESDSDDLRGPFLACSDCHDTNNFPYFKSGTDSNGNGTFELSETDVCSACHSPGGAFNGVTSTGDSVGAKGNWAAAVYDGPNLQANKEKWCIGCHDASPAIVSGEAAPDKAGNNSSYGYYVTGHGRISNYARMSWQDSAAPGNPGADQACTNCHDSAARHIDKSGSRPRLKTGGLNDQNNSNCVNCHIPGGAASAAPEWFTSNAAYESSAHGGTLCTACHDVHGMAGTNGAMTKGSDENLCYQCHTEGGVVNNAVSGAALASDIQEAFTMTGGIHNLGSSFTLNAKNHTLECTSCHNVHLVSGKFTEAAQNKSPVTRFSDNREIWGDGTGEKMDDYAGSGNYLSNSYNGSQLPDYVTFCRDCHNATSTIYSPLKRIDWNNEKHGRGNADVDIRVSAPYTSGNGNLGYVLSCLDCHEAHGSSNIFLLRAEVNGAALTGAVSSGDDFDRLCLRCHSSDWKSLHHTITDRVYQLRQCGPCHGTGGSNPPPLNCQNCHFHDAQTGSDGVTNPYYAPTGRRTF